MCVYGRLRYGDSQGIEQEPIIDGEFLEAGTSMHKTDSMVGRARRLLPVAAPAVGLTASGIWLCEILQKYDLYKGDLTNVGARSMKATALSWLAKAAVPEKMRRMLGYHVKPKDKSLMIYSRDALAGPLGALCETVAQVASGKFRPDESRSGRWERAEHGDASRSTRTSRVTAQSLMEKSRKMVKQKGS